MKKRAYTLVEIIIGLVVIAVITYGLGVFIIKGMDAWQLLRERNTLQAEARMTAIRLTQQLRNIPGTTAIAVFSGTEIQFTDASAAAQNFKLVSNAGGYSITYNGYSLTDNAAADGLAFTYLDSAGVVTAVKADIRAIRFKIKLEKGKESIKIESSSRLRIVT